MDVEQLTDWLWCLRTPVVQAYAVRERDGFNVIDASTAGAEAAILGALGSVAGDEVRIADVLVTHGHDDHIGSAAALADRTGARVLGPAADAPVIEGERPAPPPDLADWEVALYEQALQHVPPAPPVALHARVDDGTRLDWERPARIVGAPGHTAGSVALDVHIACFGHGDPLVGGAGAQLARVAAAM
jgi:glyoxylase-like metal-dependent hydrolase (beta-lactamase superfamily II)